MGSVEDFPQQMADANIAFPENAALSRWRNNDSGAIESRALFMGVSVATAALLGLMGRFGIGVSNGIDLHSGKGTVESTYVMPANVCHGGYINKIDGASAKLQASAHANLFGWHVGGHIPTDWVSETFNGEVSSIVCNTGTNGTRRVNHNKHTDNVSVPEGSLNTYVFITNPLAKNFSSDGGFIAVNALNSINLLNTIPGIHMSASDQVHNVLQGFSELEAFNTSATACGEKSWGDIKESYEAEIKQDEVTQLNEDDSSGYHWTTRDITVHVPATAAFHTQYGNYLQQAESEAEAQGISINAPSTAPVCEDTSGPTQVLQSVTQATNAGLNPNVVATPSPTQTSGGIN